MKSDRAFGRADAEFLTERRHSTLIPAHRGCSVAAPIMQPHHVLVRALASRVVVENARAVVQPLLVFLMRFAILDQLVESYEIHAMQPLAFIQTPVLVTA